MPGFEAVILAVTESYHCEELCHMGGVGNSVSHGEGIEILRSATLHSSLLG